LLSVVVSAESFSHLYCVIRKLSSHSEAVRLLTDLENIITIGTVTPDVVTQALSSGWRDFEDALQHFCAIHENCDVIVTRNTSDYRKASIPVYTPREWLEEI